MTNPLETNVFQPQSPGSLNDFAAAHPASTDILKDFTRALDRYARDQRLLRTLGSEAIERQIVLTPNQELPSVAS